MIEIQFFIGDTLDSAYERLVKTAEEKKEDCYGKFNDNLIYSTDTLDEVYQKVTGKTKAEYDEAVEAWRDNYRKGEEEFKKKIPELTEKYCKEARGLILEEKYDEWDTIVPVRLADLYHGMEVAQTLDICRIMRDEKLSYDERLKKAYDLFMESGHSGMSATLTAEMLRRYCPDGVDLADAVMHFRFEKKEEEKKK